MGPYYRGVSHDLAALLVSPTFMVIMATASIVVAIYMWRREKKKSDDQKH